MYYLSQIVHLVKVIKHNLQSHLHEGCISEDLA